MERGRQGTLREVQDFRTQVYLVTGNNLVTTWDHRRLDIVLIEFKRTPRYRLHFGPKSRPRRKNEGQSIVCVLAEKTRPTGFSNYSILNVKFSSETKHVLFTCRQTTDLTFCSRNGSHKSEGCWSQMFVSHLNNQCCTYNKYYTVVNNGINNLPYNYYYKLTGIRRARINTNKYSTNIYGGCSY